jgi:hypothetical protein
MNRSTVVNALVVLGLVLPGCAARQGHAREPDEGVSPRNPCEGYLFKTQKAMIAVLEALPRLYWMEGVILRVEEPVPNRYDVWIQRREATDIITFQTTISPECQVTVVRIAERVADRPAFGDPCSQPAREDNAR